MSVNRQSEINIGMIGHVDHGKTTLTKALTGVWTDKHSEEIKRGISIRLGYADCNFYRCRKCNEPECYSTQKKCPRCSSDTELLRRVSFVDSPGHETLMATMLSGAAIMDGAILVIAANEDCPQPQTAEHLMALGILGVNRIVIAQNKIDLVSRDEAIKNYKQIQKFIKGTIAENSSIIPIAAHYGANIDVLIKAIEEHIPTPERDITKEPKMRIARSFDINKPGASIDSLRGGVVGGSILKGKFKVGDEIEFSPGVKINNKFRKISTKIVSLSTGNTTLKEARPGGLIAIGTELDPSLTKSDNLLGNVIGLSGTVPEPREKLNLEVHLLNRLIGIRGEVAVEPLKKNESLMLSVGGAITLGTVIDLKRGELSLKLPVCAEKGELVAIGRRIDARWRLVGYGIVKD
ncbi:MAG TPA: translation initiation factor IF-2 subunit gamma [Candidatus Altiarchaeales archaeon]|nr:translation initiation factor IF-2 subunit gamma [Candidatus Altiarchaeales archaeon]